MIAVTGATGHLGGLVVEELLARRVSPGEPVLEAGGLLRIAPPERSITALRTG